MADSFTASKYSELPPFDYTLYEENCGLEWKSWHRSFEWYLKANQIEDESVKFVKLLHLAGRKVQELFESLPACVAEVACGPLASECIPHPSNYELALSKLNDFFEPKRNATYERHVFRLIKQEKNEKFGIFVIRLRIQADKCDFGEGSEDNIKDQTIEKCFSAKLRRELLKLGDCKLENILRAAKVFEAVEEQCKTFDSSVNTHNQSSENVNKIDSQAMFKTNWEKEKQIVCTRCGYAGHRAFDEKCPAKGKICNKCGGKDHFIRKCRSQKRMHSSNTAIPKEQNFKQRMKRESQDQKTLKPPEPETIKLLDSTTKPDEYIFCIGDNMSNEIHCKIGGVAITVVVDSGSKYNIIDGSTWEFLKANKIKVSNQRKGADGHEFKAYGGHPLSVIGIFEATVETTYKSCVADFYVVKDYGKALIGYETGIPLGVMKIGENINQIEEQSNISKIKGFVVDIPLKENIKPVAQPYRRVPVPLEEAVDKKIDELLEQGIIEKVNEPSQWISPIVPVPKGDDVRVCIDMRRANEAVQRENHPLPTMENFLPHIGKGQFFTKLDVKNAFHQVEISKESRPITTFITRKGLFRYTRLMFGIACAPELFQKIMEQILVGCEGCLNYIDDIIIYGETIEQLNKRVEKVLQTLKNYNVLLNQAKCIFGVRELEFLGHKLSASGITPTQSKVEDVQNFRCPSCIAEVRSFLGLVNFVGKFIPNLANITEPLRALTRKNAIFKWQTEQQVAFESLKKCLTNELVLGFYDVRDRTQVYADASPIALGAVLIQLNEKGPRVITYASKSLTDTEKRYCQTEKEALALVWSVERFNFYLFGRTFELVTDHKALETIFSPTSKPCARIERWVLRLQSYKFKVIYKPGKNNIADPLSRLVVTNKSEPWSNFDTEQYVNFVVENSIPFALKLVEIEEASKKDLTICDVKTGLTECIWSDRARPFKVFETELCFAGNILLRGNRIVMPECLRMRTIELAHEGHPGITVMKRRLRSKVWWPKIDTESESFVKKCYGCTMVAAPPPPEPLKRRELPSEPWSHLAIDFMGPLPSSHYLLVIVDYFSRFIEVEIMTKITTFETIKRLRVIFARFGRPNLITADNGTQFTSSEFKDYCSENNIQIVYSTPFWPQQNGEVERQNRSILKRLKISQSLNQDWQKELQDYLLMYRSTPHSTTLKSPSELMFGRTIRDKLPQINQPLLHDEELHDRDKTKKEKEKLYADEKRSAKDNMITVGDLVWLKNLVNTNKLSVTFEPIDFKVIKRSGSEIVVEGLESGVRYRRNVSHAIRVPVQNEKESKDKGQAQQQSSEQMDLNDQEPTTSKRANTYDLPPRQRRAPTKLRDYTQ